VARNRQEVPLSRGGDCANRNGGNVGEADAEGGRGERRRRGRGGRRRSAVLFGKGAVEVHADRDTDTADGLGGGRSEEVAKGCLGGGGDELRVGVAEVDKGGVREDNVSGREEGGGG